MTPTTEISRGASGVDFELDWADPSAPGGSWLKPGEAIASHQVTVAGGLVKQADSLSGSVTKALVNAPDSLAVGTRVAICFKVTTNSTPPRVESRFWDLTVVRRSPSD